MLYKKVHLERLCSEMKPAGTRVSPFCIITRADLISFKVKMVTSTPSILHCARQLLLYHASQNTYMKGRGIGWTQDQVGKQKNVCSNIIYSLHSY